MKKLVLLLLLLLLPVAAIGQGIDVRPRHVIDTPTAWPLPRAGFDLSARAFGDGGVILALNVGVSNQFMFGASYGGTHILGEDSLQWNRAPGVMARYNLIIESYALPAISIGFESQGYGPYIPNLSRYANKSPGFYVVASKRYDFLEFLDFHGGVNYSLERADGDRDFNLFAGASLAFNQDFELLSEYDFALNDTKEKVSLGEGTGYLNAGLRLNIKDAVNIEVFLKNLLKNRRTAKYYNREFKITFFQFIL
jgi:hypothetical protein